VWKTKPKKWGGLGAKLSLKREEAKPSWGSTPYLYLSSGLRTAQWNLRLRLLLQKKLIKLPKRVETCTIKNEKRPPMTLSRVGVRIALQKLPGFHLAERLILDVLAVVAPLPLVALPIVNAADPNVGTVWKEV
jgi:hypothetical protein